MYILLEKKVILYCTSTTCVVLVTLEIYGLVNLVEPLLCFVIYSSYLSFSCIPRFLWFYYKGNHTIVMHTYTVDATTLNKTYYFSNHYETKACFNSVSLAACRTTNCWISHIYNVYSNLFVVIS